MRRTYILLPIVILTVLMSGCTTKVGVTPCTSDADCAEGKFCEFPDCESAEGECITVPESCYTLYEPECGCDGNTYSNNCYRRMAETSLQYEGDCAKSQLELEESYSIDIDFYGDAETSYESSMVMLLDYRGEGSWVTGDFLDSVEVPTDIFGVLETYGLKDDVKIGYASGYDAERGTLYNGFVDNTESQIVVFGDQGEAFVYLKSLVESDTPVMAVLDGGMHYVVVTGYDGDNVFVNDPSEGESFISNTVFLERWGTVGSYEYDEPFPGRFALVWF